MPLQAYQSKHVKKLEGRNERLLEDRYQVDSAMASHARRQDLITRAGAEKLLLKLLWFHLDSSFLYSKDLITSLHPRKRARTRNSTPKQKTSPWSNRSPTSHQAALSLLSWQYEKHKGSCRQKRQRWEQFFYRNKHLRECASQCWRITWDLDLGH